MTTVQTVDDALNLLLQATKKFPHASLDICTGYISTNGIFQLQDTLKSIRTPRAIVGLNPTNRINAFRMLRNLGVQVYIYVAPPRTIFHPKIYFGASETQAWAMIGSSNLTESGLLTNIEHNLFITGQRHIEPFSSIEARVEAFIKQSYPFDREFERSLLEVERRLTRNQSPGKYDECLLASGIKTKERLELTVPDEVRHSARRTLDEFVRTTTLEYAYQMLLLLVMISRSDANGWFAVEETAHCFMEFYRLRREAGLPPEKKRGAKRAVVDNPAVSLAEMSELVKTRPFPRFERKGLLGLSEDGLYFIVNPALVEDLTGEMKRELRELALRRIATHFEQDIIEINALVINL